MERVPEVLERRWICNKCRSVSTEKPYSRNTTCADCKRGRRVASTLCKCGQWFSASHLGVKYCSKPCMYRYRNVGGRKGNHYPNAQRARVGSCLTCGSTYRAVADFKDRQQRYCSHSCYMRSRSETNPERKVREYLERAGIYFCQEFKIGTYWIDFYLPDARLAIEVDGEYWHAFEKVMARDKRKDAFLQSQGVDILRIKEREVGALDVIVKRWENMTGLTAERISPETDGLEAENV